MIDGSVLQSAQRCFEKKSRVVVKMVVKQSRFLTAFQQNRNPLIQLNQDNIENTEKRRTMPPTLPTENETIQQKNIPNCKQTNFQFPD